MHTLQFLLPLRNYIPSLEKLNPSSLIIRFAPKPGALVSRVGSLSAAAIAGELYGIGVRYFSQSRTVVPHHYAMWFALAYQIQEWLHVSKALAVAWVESTPTGPSASYIERFRSGCHHSLGNFDKLDQAISDTFDIRPRKEINQNNIDQAQYLEMCRARAWKVFKRTVVEVLSFTLSCYAVTYSGFPLYTNYSVSLYVLGKWALIDTFIVPLLHQLVQEQPGKESPRVYKWIKYVLPEL